MAGYFRSRADKFDRDPCPTLSVQQLAVGMDSRLHKIAQAALAAERQAAYDKKNR